MKKIVLFLLAAALMIALCCQANAANFELDDKAIVYAMDGRSWYQGYTPKVQYGSFSICLPLRSERAVGNIQASIALDDPDLLLFRSQPGTVTVTPRDSIYPVVMNIPLSPNRRNGDYAAKITVSGQDSGGEPITEVFPYVIRVRDGSPSLESITPKITVSGDLQVGKDCSLHLSVTNPTTTLSMTKCALSLKDESGEVLMSGSDRMELPEILPGQTAQVDVPLSVKGNAKVEIHSFSLKLTYSVLEAEQVWEETLSYPVTQEIRLEQGSMSLPPSALQGDLTNLSIPLMNMGKGDICNAMVTLEFPGLIQRQSVLVGTIEPGTTGQAKLTFTPGKEALGDYAGTVTISCEDRYGNSRQWQLPVDITIEPAKEPAAAEETEPVITPPSWLLPAACVLCVMLIFGIILQGALLRGKLHRLEEERL